MTGLQGGCIKGSADVSSVPDFEDTVGVYDTTVLDQLDATLSRLHANGIKAIISPHDAGQINGANGCDAYCRKYGNQTNFYTSAAGVADYDARLSAILNYESPAFGKKWSQLDEVILAFDVQNEPMIDAAQLLEGGDPGGWLCGRAGVLKGLAGDESAVQVATGGIGGSHYCCDHQFNDLDSALRCEAFDIVSVHGYMSRASDWAYFTTGDASVLRTTEAAGTGHRVMVEEWGVAAASEDGFDEQVGVFNDAGVPWVSAPSSSSPCPEPRHLSQLTTPLQLYWQVVPGRDQSQDGAPAGCGYDGFEIGLDSPRGDVAGAVGAAGSTAAWQDWSGSVL